MHWYYKLGLGNRLALSGAALTTIIVVALLSFADSRTERNAAADQSNAIVAAQLAQSATNFVINSDNLALQALLRELTEHPIVTYATVMDSEHQILVESGTSAPDNPQLTSVTRAIVLGDATVGYVGVKFKQLRTGQFNRYHILLLGGMVFTTLWLSLRLGLHRLDHTLEASTRHLQALLPHASTSPDADILARLDALAAATAQCYGAAADDKPGAVLTLRLGSVDAELDADTPGPATLTRLARQVAQTAEACQASVCGRGDGWIFSFRCGPGRALRALHCARQLIFLLENSEEPPVWSMAIDTEAQGAQEQSPELRELHWYRHCDSAYALAQEKNELLVTRLALSEPDINQHVQVCQEEGDSYRVRAFSGNLEPPTEAQSARSDDPDAQ